MRRITLPLLALALPLLLAACGSATAPAGQASTAPSASAASAVRLAGNWQTVNYVMDYKGENLAGPMADVAKAGKASVGKKDLGETCLAADVVAKDDLNARLQEAIIFGPEWKVEKSEFKDGNVDFAATMDNPQQGKGRMTITGMVTPTTADLILTTDAWQPAPGKGHIHTVLKTEARHTGPCKPE